MKKFFTCWLPLMIYCLVIFVQSHQAFPDELPSWPLSDKLLHLGGYTLLGILFYRALGTLSWAADKRKHITAAIIATGLYGLSDEFHQSFVAERTADAMDAFMDLLGGGLGVFIYRSSRSWIRRRIPNMAALTSHSGSDNSS